MIEPDMGPGPRAITLNGRPCPATLKISASPARRASLGLEPVSPAATTLYETSLGQRAVPTFFWGEVTSPGRLQRIADRLILMGDWRDSDRSQ